MYNVGYKMTNVEHIKQILMILRAEYGSKVIIDDARIALWHLILGHTSPPEIERAVAKLLAKGGQFPPSVGEVNQTVLEARRGVQEDWGKLWDKVVLAAQRSTYYAAEEAAKLPRLALEAIGGIPGLKELAASSPEHMSVMRGQFRQRYEAVSNSDKAELLQDALGAMTPNKQIEDK